MVMSNGTIDDPVDRKAANVAMANSGPQWPSSMDKSLRDTQAFRLDKFTVEDERENLHILDSWTPVEIVRLSIDVSMADVTRSNEAFIVDAFLPNWPSILTPPTSTFTIAIMSKFDGMFEICIFV